MKYFLLFFFLAVSNASIIPLVHHVAPVSAIIKGPSASSASAGSYGASASYVEGATIAKVGNGAALLSPGIVAHAAAPVIAPAQVIAPVVAPVIAPVHVAPVVVAPGPIVVSHGTGAVIAGPSGTIATSNGLGLGVAPIIAGPVVGLRHGHGHGW